MKKASPPSRKPPAGKARAERGECTPPDRPAERGARQRRSGEGSESALANLRSIERDRQKNRPADDGGNGD